MKALLVVTITCPDAPGIVDKLSKVIIAHGANWEESRMARLAGVFAGLLKVSVATEKAEALAANLRDLASETWTVVVKYPPAIDPYQDYLPLRLSLSGADHEGIIHGISSFLAERGVNVEEVETEITNAPWSGGPLFRADFELKSPPSLPADELRDKLNHLAASLAVDIELEEIEN